MTPCAHCGSLYCGEVRCRFSMRPQPAYAALLKAREDARKVEAYASAMIERDRLLGWLAMDARHDTDTGGRPLRPGT